MGEYKAIIIDDEDSGRENLRLFIEDYCSEIVVVATAKNAFEAQLRIKEMKPDIIFLDINLGAISGIELQESFLKSNYQTIFVSAYKEFALQTLKLGAVGYVLKPIIADELIAAVELAKEIIQKQAREVKNDSIAEVKKILLQDHGGYKYIPIDDITYAEAINNYCIVHLKNNENTAVSKPLKWLEQQISSKKFYRIHKTYLVNLKCVEYYKNTDGGVIVMTDGTKLKVAVSKRAELRTILGNEL